MPFEIKYATAAGTFNIKLERDVSGDEAIQLSQFAFNVLGIKATIEKHTPTFSEIGSLPAAIQSSVVAHWVDNPHRNVASPTTVVSTIAQTKLGERPAKAISLGYYKEPKTG